MCLLVDVATLLFVVNAVAQLHGVCIVVHLVVAVMLLFVVVLIAVVAGSLIIVVVTALLLEHVKVFQKLANTFYFTLEF